ncbi:MAG: ATP-binding protein [Planctomycetota bacterium]|nr:ATP-binding protein [Planctomycetota bacterium]
MTGWILLGAVVSGPLWIGLGFWLCRRAWRQARRMVQRSRGHDRLAALGTLAGGLAHEIRNPLSTINVNLQLLAEDLARHDDDEHNRLARRLASVRTEAGRLKEILDDFLNYARRHELHPARTDLRQIVSDMADFFASQADAAHVVLRTLPGEAPIPVEVDVNLITQAVLEVIDTGTGMDEPCRQRIFDPFYTTKGRGAGLGLPTTKRIILEHHGAIRVDSEPGKGTRFTVTLPLAGEGESRGRNKEQGTGN